MIVDNFWNRWFSDPMGDVFFDAMLKRKGENYEYTDIHLMSDFIDVLGIACGHQGYYHEWKANDK